jgi:hypothetical protein
MYMYFMVIWYILLPFGTFCGLLTNFSRIWYVVPIKIGQTCHWAQSGHPAPIAWSTEEKTLAEG